MMKRSIQTLLLGLLAVSGSLAGEVKNLPADGPKGLTWESPLPEDCPFQKSTSLTGLFFTGRHSDCCCGGAWYPCRPSDGNLRLKDPPVEMVDFPNAALPVKSTFDGAGAEFTCVFKPYSFTLLRLSVNHRGELP